MRYLILMFLLITNFLVFGQSKKELRSNIYDLTNKYDELNENYIKLDKKYNALKEKHSVSFDTPENYAKSLFKFLKSKNKNEASKLLISVDDSNLFSAKLNQEIKEEADRDSISVSDWIQAWNDKFKKTFDETYYEGLNLGIKWEESIFTKAEFKIEYEDDVDTYMIDPIKVFFRYSNKDYYFNIRDAFIINDKPLNWRLSGPYDIQAQKLEKEKREKQRLEGEKQKEIELQNKPYTPWNLSVGGTNWSYSLNDKKTFTEFRCKIYNNTDYFVERVKFRVSIYTGAAYSGGTKVFSKTYDLDYYEPTEELYRGLKEDLELQPGDIQQIQIKELNGFWLGVDSTDDDEWYAKYEILDVSPKHNN
jgi:hypothetical protein